jgi:hypothetical protein
LAVHNTRVYHNMVIIILIFNNLKFNLEFNQLLIALVNLKHYSLLYTLMYDCVSHSELAHEAEFTTYETLVDDHVMTETCVMT